MLALITFRDQEEGYLYNSFILFRLNIIGNIARSVYDKNIHAIARENIRKRIQVQLSSWYFIQSAVFLPDEQSLLVNLLFRSFLYDLSTPIAILPEEFNGIPRHDNSLRSTIHWSQAATCHSFARLSCFTLNFRTVERLRGEKKKRKKELARTLSRIVRSEASFFRVKSVPRRWIATLANTRFTADPPCLRDAGIVAYVCA